MFATFARTGEVLAARWSEIDLEQAAWTVPADRTALADNGTRCSRPAFIRLAGTTHTPNGVAVSAQKSGLLPISQQSMSVLSSLAYHGYEGLALNEDEKPRLVRDLGDKNFLMLRNHGLLTAAASIADAFAFMYFFEASCMIQVRAQSGGSELIPIPQPVLDGFPMAANKARRGAGPGTLAWPALLRKLDRLDPSFRD